MKQLNSFILKRQPRLRLMPHMNSNVSKIKFDTAEEWLWDNFKFDPHSQLAYLRDTIRLRRSPVLKRLHQQAVTHVNSASTSWLGYDFGHGYFYQSFQRAGITGRRSTEHRISSMKLDDLTHRKSVLDIGSNTGFIALMIAEHARQVVGIEPNQSLTQIAKLYEQNLSVQNCQFHNTRFENFHPREQFDVVLSLSNHFSYDGMICGSIEGYLTKCVSHIRSNGLCILETHTPHFESRQGGITLLEERFAEHFNIVGRGEIKSPLRLDAKRFFFVGRKK